MKWDVEIGICWTHGTWTTMIFTVNAETEELAIKLAHDEALRWVEDFAQNGMEAAHLFTYSVDENCEEDDD